MQVRAGFLELAGSHIEGADDYDHLLGPEERLRAAMARQQ
jgi:hypothetical protein